ncbi:efflux RND transporter permease subunit [Reichenbachiella ulvae]|uniref:Efflux RND transporter permease subunit n=1 Tax=Reichenbachiella ulvae TaxID=2980104 RepID=A0ABT3CV14_9BACT|nr:efflux RND transporter permease subunit [Reichenbachiella ulvae]MCV9387513.1 efflux RND transporter permease subunit [Reichenbachiella ulvae]
MSGVAGNLAKQFINSKLTPLLMIAFVAVGIYSAVLTPKEEEPQIDVPIADIFLQYPGASSEEVESRIVAPLEALIADIHGVEYVYSQSMEGQAFLVVRYLVGEDIERSIVKLYNEIQKHMDQMPRGVTPPLIKTRSIDDVPMLGVTFFGEEYGDYDLRRVIEELSAEIENVDDVSSVKLYGGRSRQVQVVLDPQLLASYGLDTDQIAHFIQSANQEGQAGTFVSNNYEYQVHVGNFIKNAEELADLVVGVVDGAPIYLKQVAEVKDGPSLPSEYVAFGYGAGSENLASKASHPAVTLSVAKRKGADAMQVAQKVLDKIEAMEGTLIPSDMEYEVVRNYGETASHKVQELMIHLGSAILAVTIVVMLSMGWRGGLVVFLSVPVTFALTLFVYYVFGYTLNRITLFALVFVTGIVVDDSIIIAENMHRHFKMKKKPFMQAAIASINEVGNPTILATFTVIAAVLPMIFVSGLMGPYMSPMPIGASLAMFFSLLVALVITPYLAYHLLKNDKGETKEFVLEETMIYRGYNYMMQPLINNAKYRWSFIGGVTVLMLASFSLVYFKLVAVKMLPFDNKNEFQVVIDMPEGAALEKTSAVTREIAAYLQTQPEVVSYQSYAGTAAPINFNGLVRHYDLRKAGNLGDIQVNLLDKGDRDTQSHDIAKRVRAEVQKIAATYGANAKVVEVPPGPPVISTIVAEIYGQDMDEQIKIAEQVKQLLSQTDDVVDVDWMVEDDQVTYDLVVDKRKAMSWGISSDKVLRIVSTALNGASVSFLHDEKEKTSTPIQLRVGEEKRSSIEDIQKLTIQGQGGQMVALGDIVTINERAKDKAIFRKNQKRVVYVVADVAGNLESPVYAILSASDHLSEIEVPAGYDFKEYYTSQPFTELDYGIKWDGEWHITYEVFRDLGSAFAVVLVIIYLLIVGWFQDFKVPIVMMVAIPLSLVGILVGHWLLDAFFTATSMIGMIALAGIMVRNSVLLIDFINLRTAEGVPIAQAVIEAGAVRTTPILLTAGTVVIGAFVILFDPIFQGLAISLMGGSIASTVLTLLIVPLIYYMTEKNKKTANNKES